MDTQVIQDKVLVVKTTLQKWLGYAKYILIGGLILTIIILYYQNKSLDKNNQIQAVELMSQTDSAKMYKTKAGEAYFQTKAVEVEANALKKSLEAQGFDLKKLKAEKVNLSNVVSSLKMELVAAGTIHTNVRDSIVYDTIKGNTLQQHIIWSNQFLSLNGVIKNKEFSATYLYQTKINSVTEKKGKSYIVTTSLSDPQAKITNGSQVIITPTSKWYMKPWLWGVAGLAAGVFIAK